MLHCVKKFTLSFTLAQPLVLMRFMTVPSNGTAGIVHACCKGLNESHLTSAISFEVQNGYHNMRYRSMRFSNILHSKLLHWCSRSRHFSSQKLLEESSAYSSVNIPERSKLLNEVSILMGYSNVQDLIEQENIRNESKGDANAILKDFDLTLALSRFPCIVLGDSSVIELYSDAPHHLEIVNPLLPGSRKYSVDRNWKEANRIGEALQFTGPTISNIISHESESHVSEDKVPNMQVENLGSKTKSDAQVQSEKSLEAGWSSDARLIPHLYLGQTGRSSSCKLPSNLLAGNLDSRMKPESQVGNESSQSESISCLDASLATQLSLGQTVRGLPNATSRQCRQLEDCGFHTVRKLLHHFPRTYADLQNIRGTIEDGHYLICVGTVLSSRGIRAGSSFSFLEVIVGCEVPKEELMSEINDREFASSERKMIYLHLKKFFRGTRFTSQPFLKSVQSKYKEGDRVYVSGKVKKMHPIDHFEIREYSIDRLEEADEQQTHVEKRPYPLYPSKAGLKPNFLRDIISRALKSLPMNIDPMPNEIVKEFNLLNLYDAYNGIHHPKNLTEADLARRRLIFDEFFYLQLGRLFQMLEAPGTKIEKDQLLHKYKNNELYGVPIEEWTPLTKKLLKALPFSLTPSQLNAVSEIIYDLKRPVPMNRLLQGDVGCGKTVVAFLACMEVVGLGFQAAFMVPTELLAVQHYDRLLSLLEIFGEDNCKPSVALLTGSTPLKQSRLVLKGLQTGEIAMVIGTHSLIADKVEFSALRIAVVDEQHRFGVVQRGRFNSKLYSTSFGIKSSLELLDESLKEKGSMAPHVLAMSATPIPRTLALALFGDMSLTQITDLPPGRTPIKTFVLEGNEAGFENVFKMMQDELMGGGKVYLVYPVITESEQLPQLRAATAELKSISERFKMYQCGLLHGRMKSEEKDEALKKFRSGETQILLATQVIEIGVDVPDASMMVVMNAERFGIAQLHQLRGRVGRGERDSKCVFFSSTSSTLDRLKVLEKSSDGFFLANADLLIRGPGNLLGKKQSGHLPEFPIARMEIDGNILQEAHLAAMKVLATSSDLEKFPGLKAELSMRQPLCLLGD